MSQLEWLLLGLVIFVAIIIIVNIFDNIFTGRRRFLFGIFRSHRRRSNYYRSGARNDERHESHEYHRDRDRDRDREHHYEHDRERHYDRDREHEHHYEHDRR